MAVGDSMISSLISLKTYKMTLLKIIKITHLSRVLPIPYQSMGL